MAIWIQNLLDIFLIEIPLLYLTQIAFVQKYFYQNLNYFITILDILYAIYLQVHFGDNFARRVDAQDIIMANICLIDLVEQHKEATDSVFSQWEWFSKKPIALRTPWNIS